MIRREGDKEVGAKGGSVHDKEGRVVRWESDKEVGDKEGG